MRDELSFRASQQSGQWVLRQGAWHRTLLELKLSRREAQIVECLLDLEDSEPLIAERLGMSRHTVHTHLIRLYGKLRVKSRCQLVAFIFAAYLRCSCQPTAPHSAVRPALSPD